MPQSKPNILIVMVDQLSPGFLPIYGHPLVKTPNLETLATSGMIFSNAYCNSPLCSPSRAAFMTGSLPSRNGVYDNAAEFRSDIPTFAHYLRQLGYSTTLAGKMHFCGPDQLHGFEERLTTDIYPADYGWTPNWDQPDVRPDWYHTMDAVIDAGLCVRTSQLDFDEETTFAAERAIYGFATNRDRPFLLVASLNSPHEPYAITREYWDLYSHDAVDMPRVNTADVPLDPHTRRLRHMCDMDIQPTTKEEVRNARHAYFGAISFCDYNLGKLLRALDRTGLRDETVVVFLCDHGEMLGERGLWYKMTFMEGAARVPLVIAGPGVRAGRNGSAVSLIDILPTLLSLAGGDPTRDLVVPIDGQSLMPHLSGEAGRDEVLGEYLAEGVVAPMVMLRRGTHKFIHSRGDPDQLYNLVADPDERVNLADHTEVADLVAAFRAEVATRWNLTAMDHAVRDSQRRRRFVDAALKQGTRTPWDFQPFKDASRQYFRNLEGHTGQSMERFPPVRASF